MGTEAVTKRPGPGRYVQLGLALAGTPLCLWALLELAAGLYVQIGLESSDPQRRAAALVSAADRREERALNGVLDILAREQDRTILEKAGYAALRINDLRAMSLMIRRAEQGPDDWTRGKMMLYAARLSQRDPRLASRLEAGVQDEGPWRRAASMLGMIELGRPEGGRLLINALPELPTEVRSFALDEFRRRAGPAILETLGVSMDWSGLESAPATDPRFHRLSEVWEQAVSARLLNNVLDRQDYQQPDWFMVSRLVHAREKVTRWF